MKFFLSILFVWVISVAYSQTGTISGKIKSEGLPVEFASIALSGTSYGTISDSTGHFILEKIPLGNYTLVVSALGFMPFEQKIQISGNKLPALEIELSPNISVLNEVVVSGTLKEVSKLDSPVPVEVYTAKFFKSNPTPSVFDALQNVNGVRPQLNCNVCNTGDIHINGLEGPYTMVMIDGMPIVSGLSSVYGLSGIPQSLIERVEIVKGPASTLYGSEAVGGLINIITKKTSNAPVVSADIFATGWGEINTDLASKFQIGDKTDALLGVNYFNYSIPTDKNDDGFTDVTLQDRISVFNKWSFGRKHNRIFSLAGRYIYEDRWGGDMNWNRSFRGGDSIYGESIYTNRVELFGTYQLPVPDMVLFQFSANGHDQNSVYGNTIYDASQYIGFGQLTWNKIFRSNDILVGAAYRYTYYDDNTPATATFDTIEMSINMPSHAHLPGLFIQDEITLDDQNKFLVGMRYDYNSIHGSIFTPRLNYKWSSEDKSNILRVSVGNGYRVANVFTEDHAALTGSRQVEFLEDLKPETSWNGNLNFVKKIFAKGGTFVGLDATAFYTYFDNKIIADYELDPNKIIYDNLRGYAVSQGVSLNVDLSFENGLKVILGGTYMDVFSVEENIRIRQLFTEKFTGVWSVSYSIQSIGLAIDYTGNVYSPMKLPLISDLDPRTAFSPWWSIQNIQLTQSINKKFEVYAGVKNLLNWTPNKGNPFIIARTHDPFDKLVEFDDQGQAISTSENPYALTFDPTYMYAPNQGIRFFAGIRYTLK